MNGKEQNLLTIKSNKKTQLHFGKTLKRTLELKIVLSDEDWEELRSRHSEGTGG